MSGTMEFAGKRLRVLIIVENLPLPFDRRVWQEANALRRAGHEVSIICPTGKGYEERYEEIDGIAIYRHPLPTEGSSPSGYLKEYSSAFWWELKLSMRVLRERGFDVLQACNPPDNIFLIGLFYKVFLGKKFVFDHHDLNPELYLAKFGKKDLFYRLMLLLEKLTFLTADFSIATNESYRQIAVERGAMSPERVAVVRSGPCLERLRIVSPNPEWKNGRTFLVGYLGVMGKQEGLDHLLRAAAELIQIRGRRDIQFVLVGDGTELEAIRQMGREMGLEDYLFFTGRVSDAVMLEVLCTADVCVNPDVANEMNDKSTMNKIMEYMALGRPIVQYDLTEGRFSAQEASLYARPNDHVDMAEKIALLLDDPHRREVMGQAGRKRVMEDLHWGVEEPKYLRVFQALSTGNEAAAC
jgi:glycosyltransferase involved in cell wall biosynthesis